VPVRADTGTPSSNFETSVRENVVSHSKKRKKSCFLDFEKKNEKYVAYSRTLFETVLPFNMLRYDMRIERAKSLFAVAISLCLLPSNFRRLTCLTYSNCFYVCMYV